MTNEQKDALEMANNAIARALVDVEQYSAAIKEHQQELEEVEQKLKEWGKSNPSSLKSDSLDYFFSFFGFCSTSLSACSCFASFRSSFTCFRSS